MTLEYVLNEYTQRFADHVPTYQEMIEFINEYPDYHEQITHYTTAWLMIVEDTPLPAQTPPAGVFRAMWDAIMQRVRSNK